MSALVCSGQMAWPRAICPIKQFVEVSLCRLDDQYVGNQFPNYKYPPLQYPLQMLCPNVVNHTKTGHFNAKFWFRKQ